MKKTLVVVANRAKAKFFTISSVKGPLRSAGELGFPEGRDHDREFTTDEPGQSFQSHGHGRSQYSKENSIDEQLVGQFCATIAENIERHRNGNGGFEHLLLVGESKFLGHLKQKLSSPTTKLLLGTVSRDVVDESESSLSDRVIAHLKDYPELIVE